MDSPRRSVVARLRYVSGMNRAIIVHMILTLSLDMVKELGCDRLSDLKPLLASIYSIQCSFKPRTRKEVLIEQIGAI